jgi:protein-L-isoaspartate(D-aspartate) O-methyltransferase
MTDFALARRNMVDGQLRPNRVTNAALLAAVGELPRERFLPDGLRSVAYADDDVPLGNGRFLMEPMVLARLIQALQAQPGDKALVVASGRGYGAALLSRLVVEPVVAVESDPALASAAEHTFKDLGIANIHQTVTKLEAGAPVEAPYDVILIEGAVQQIPQTILDQLAEGGRLATVMAAPAGVLGVAQLVMKEGGATSGRPLFDAGTPALPGLVPAPRFTF